MNKPPSVDLSLGQIACRSINRTAAYFFSKFYANWELTAYLKKRLSKLKLGTDRASNPTPNASPKDIYIHIYICIYTVYMCTYVYLYIMYIIYIYIYIYISIYILR